jgi:pyruvate/2-oxoglutarate dehydrogenase complex dihydrolipoamide acyltransferase (E2) component
MKQKNDVIGKYSQEPLSAFRRLLYETLDEALRIHYIKALLEIDVTATRQTLLQYRRENRKGLSMLAWIIKCIGHALEEHKSLAAMRHKKKRVLFDDIDMSVAMEMNMGGEIIPRLYVVRRIQDKSAQDIHEEIYKAKEKNKETKDIDMGDTRNIKIVKLIMALPGFIRRLLWKKLLYNPFFIKRKMGTISITAVGMFGKISGFPVPLPAAHHPLSFALGSIVKKPLVIKDRVEIREVLSMTIFYDHDLIDGAPAARFTQRLKQLIEAGINVND